MSIVLDPARNPPSMLARQERAVVVIDVVESVRLIEADEVGFIERWHRFVVDARDARLPVHGARMVKHLGDGMLIEVPTAAAAVSTAFDLMQAIEARERTMPDAQRIRLRAGAHVAAVVVTDYDIFGVGVNLAARLATLARPGELVGSTELRAGLLPGLDADMEDLGECYLKHVQEPVRAFRLLPPGAGHTRPAVATQSASAWQGPKIVVLPIAVEDDPSPADGLGASITDDLVCALARASRWAVVSRLTTSTLSRRGLLPQRAAAACGARYVLAGTLHHDAGRLRARMEIHEAGPDAGMMWQAEFSGRPETLFGDAASSLVSGIVRAVCDALQLRELQGSHASAFPNLPSYALLLQAVSQLHSLSKPDVERSRLALEHLVDRHPRVAEGRAWLANWHFVQLAQVTTADRGSDIGRARTELQRALDECPDHALALALQGHLQSFVEGDLPAAEATLRRAVGCGPNESAGWLFLANTLTHGNRGMDAVAAIERARALSPLDPMAYCFDLFAARAYSAAGRHDVALPFAEAALRANCLHLSTWIQLIIEQVHMHRMDDARASAQRYLAMRPKASVTRYFDRHPARGNALARSDSDALLAAGLPP